MIDLLPKTIIPFYFDIKIRYQTKGLYNIPIILIKKYNEAFHKENFKEALKETYRILIEDMEYYKARGNPIFIELIILYRQHQKININHGQTIFHVF